MKMRLHQTIHRLGLAFLFTLLPVNTVFSQSVFPTVEEERQDNNLVSPDTGVDYTSLQNLLAKKQWRRANEMTQNLMLKATNRELQGWISKQQIEEFPCWDLKKIDSLWKKYSDGRFGFSVQYPIFVRTGNRPGRLVATESYDAFGDVVGWREPNPDPPERGSRNQWIIFSGNLNYSLDAPIGHLPNPRSEYQITGGRLEYTLLTKRMVDCKVVAAPERKTQSIGY